MVNNKISFTELGVILFVSSVSFIGSLTGDLLNGNYGDAFFAAMASTIVGWVLAVPIMVMKSYKLSNSGSVAENSSKIILWIYVVFFIYSASWDLSSVVYMMHNTVFSQLNSYIFCGIFIAVCAYCAWQGIETVARSSQIVLVIIAIGALFMFIASVNHFELTNFRVPFYSGAGDFLDSTAGVLARSLFLPQCYVLLEHTVPDKNNKTSFFFSTSLWLLASGITIAVSLVVLLLCLGVFAATQEFPMYTLSSYLPLQPLQRLDIFLGINTLSSVSIRIAATLTALKTCLVRMGNTEVSANKFMLEASAVTALLAALLSNSAKLRAILYNVPPYLVIVFLLGTVIPQISVSAARIIKRRDADEKG